MLAAIESLLSAVVADNMSGDRHKPDVELVAQGLANLVVPIFGGIPATGAIARTATNIRSGATSPVSGIVHSLTLLAIVLVAAPLAKYIPLPTLAAILMVVAYRMGEWHAIPSILRLSAADRLVWAATFAAHRVRRSHGGGRSRHGARRAALHPPRVGNDHRGVDHRRRPAG